LNGLNTVIKSDPNADGTSTNVRNYAYAFGALAAALTIMATIPFQLIKVWLNERSARTAEQSHITDQINKAVEGLGAEKTVFELDEDGKSVQRTRPNIEVRVGAIYALERISQDSLRDHVAIMEILTAYLRQNSPADTAQPFKDPETGKEMEDWETSAADASEEDRKKHLDARHERLGRWFIESKAWRWAQELKARTDIQAAVQVLGRRTPDQRAMERSDDRYGPDGYQLDLRQTNLQAVDISHLNFSKALLQNSRLEGANLFAARIEEAELLGAWMEGANLNGARMERAELSGARMEGADLSKARMEGADLIEARMEGTNLSGARMEGTDLMRARMEGADLKGAWIEGADLEAISVDQSTRLKVETNHASALSLIDFSEVEVPEDFLKSAFGDGSVILPEGYTAGEGVLAHWVARSLNWVTFRIEWHKWQDKIGYRRRD